MRFETTSLAKSRNLTLQLLKSNFQLTYFTFFYLNYEILLFLFAGAWVNCQPITFYCADDNFCQWPWEKRVREKKWDGKINVSQICSSHTLKTIKSGKEFQENKLLEFFIACLLLNMNYKLFAFKFHLKKVKFRTSKLPPRTSYRPR